MIAESTLTRRVRGYVRSQIYKFLPCLPIPRPSLLHPLLILTHLFCLHFLTVAWQNMDTQDCVAGTFQNVNGGTMCILCPSGTYSAILAQQDGNDCSKCLGGKYSVATGATSDGVCLSCEAGTYTVPGSSRCTICPLGKYGNSSSSAGSSATYCLHCGKGKFSSYAQAVNNSVCRECPAGLPFECCKGLKQNYKCMFFKHLQVRMHCALVRRVV